MSKLVRILLGAVLGLVLAFALFGGGLALGASTPALQQVIRQALPVTEVKAPIVPLPSSASEPGGAEQELFDPFWQAWRIVHDEFVDQPLDDPALMRGAIRGMLSALGDDHTGYMDPDEFQQANIELEGEYEGIGAWVDQGGEYLTIVSPMRGSPAEKAGLLPGDWVVAVDGEDMTGLDGSLVIQRIMGPAGTSVTLTIRREGTLEPFDVTLERASISVPSVEGEMVEGDIAYIQLLTFGDQTTSDLRRTIKDLLGQDPRGLILDLRGNGGGYLATSIEVASEFIPEGVILTERFGDGTEQVYRARSGGVATDIPLVVLIDGGSASASEIVAGAIQDLERGQLVGTTSFGKGSVQNWIPLDNSQGAVRVTVARWYTPSGRLISKEGLTPDVIVEITPEQLQQGLDPQLEKAIQMLAGSASEP
jgi:carboxyl-terminal processing protease